MNKNLDLTPTQNTVLTLISNALFSAEKPIDKDADWSSVWREAYMQAVSLLAFSIVSADVLPENLLSEIRLQTRAMLSKNMLMNSAHARLHTMLINAAIPYTILKGYASGRYYPDYMFRAMGDIDFLIHREDIEKASELFISAGFEMSHENHDYHRVFVKDGVRYEMHIEPSGIPGGEAGELIRSYLDNTIELSQNIKTDFGEVTVPSVFHHGLIILMHTAHHMTGSGVGLRHLCDWAVFVNSLSDEEFCGLFEEKLKKAGLWRFACVLTQTVSDYLGCPEKKWVRESCDKLCREIIQDVFSAGNFGQKDEKRSQERLFISSGKSGDKKKSSFSQLISSMNKIVYQKWKAARKLKILLPIGWLFFGGRYIIRMLMGKRPKIHPLEARSEAIERMKVYDELKLFEKETGGD